MNKKQDKTNRIEALRETSLPVAEQYTAPDIHIVEIEIEQNILTGGSLGDGMPGEGWQ